eukprot:306678_1
MSTVALPESYKSLIAEKWEEFSNTKDFRTIMTNAMLDNYCVCIANIEDKDAIIKLVIESYAKHNWCHIIFGNHLNSDAITQSIRNGRCFVIIDKTNEDIVGCTICDDFWDHFDDQQNDAYLNTNDSINPHIVEIIEDTTNATYNYVSNYYREKGGFKYGVCIYQCCTCTQHLIRNAAFSFIFSLIPWFMQNYCGYSSLMVDAVHFKMIKLAKQMFGVSVIHEIDYGNYTFKDGVNMNYYFNKIHFDRPDIDIDTFRKQCKLCAFFIAKNPTLKQYQMMAKMIRSKKIRHKL